MSANLKLVDKQTLKPDHLSDDVIHHVKVIANIPLSRPCPSGRLIPLDTLSLMRHQNIVFKRLGSIRQSTLTHCDEMIKDIKSARRQSGMLKSNVTSPLP